MPHPARDGYIRAGAASVNGSARHGAAGGCLSFTALFGGVPIKIFRLQLIQTTGSTLLSDETVDIIPQRLIIVLQILARSVK